MNLNFEEEIRKNKRRKLAKEAILWILEIIAVISLAYLLVHFCLRRTSAIGSVMEPTLYNGQEVFINTKAYLFFAVDREDVIACYDKKEESADDDESLIIFRRVIGLPGEKVQIADGKILINGKELKESYEYNPMATAGIAEQEITLGEDEYFVLCDSRYDSDDSRNASFGNVKKDQIIGKAAFKLKPFSAVSGPNKKEEPTAASAA